MKARRILLSLLFLAILLSTGLVVKFFIFDFQPKVDGALQVNSLPKTDVYLNAKNIGQTPVSLEKLIPGEYQLKLANWETKIKILPGVLTFVSREIYPNDEQSAGQILTLEKLPNNNGELVVVSNPDGATVAIDGLEKGKVSTILKNISSGDHVVVVSSSGYNDQIIHAKIIAGYRLNAIVKLGKTIAELVPTVETKTELSATPSAQETTKTVTIKDTPLGFLRVRSAPDINATESGKVFPGEKYPYVDQTDNWIKIQTATISGWVAQNYVEINQ